MKKDGHNNFTNSEPMEVWASISECRGLRTCVDPWGRKIDRYEYGQKSLNGWSIDHVLPLSRGGSNELRNLQPLHWKSNKEKDDNPNCEKWGSC